MKQTPVNCIDGGLVAVEIIKKAGRKKQESAWFIPLPANGASLISRDNDNIMSHSLVKCWIHGIWATKYRDALVEFSFEEAIYEKIKLELTGVGSHVRIVNGMPDHVHALFLLSPRRSISDTMQSVKGSSSHWINQQNFLRCKFAWQTGYAAYSVSESQVERVYQYIKNQKQHHKHQTFHEELQELARWHNLNGGIYD